MINYTVAPVVTSEQHALLQPMIRESAWPDFQRDFEEVLAFWSTTVLDTSLLGASATIYDAETMILKLDDILSDENIVYWQRRIAYLQLSKVLASAEEILKNQRRTNRFQGSACPRQSTMLLDTYARALLSGARNWCSKPKPGTGLPELRQKIVLPEAVGDGR